MPDNDLRIEAWSLPHVGTFARRLDLTKLIESFTFNDRYNDLADGVFTIPDDAVIPGGTLVKDRLLKIDEANHVNDVGSVIRLLRGVTPVHHQIVTRSEDSWSEDEPTTKFATEGLEWLLDRVTVPHYDHPADPTTEPDWIYGADTLLSNPGLEESPLSKEVQYFTHAQLSGTYTLTYSGQTTSAIDWDDGWFEVHQALEALSNIQDVVVTGNGSVVTPFIIEFLDPSGNAVLLTTTATGGIVTEVTEGGVPNPAGWTKSFHPQTGEEHGLYTTFEVSTEQAHTGTYSLKVVAAANSYVTDYPGVQQVMTVTGGRTYRMSIWVRATAAKTFRLICRTMDETAIDGAETEVTVSANTWTEIVVAPFVVPKHISQVIYRLGLIDVNGGTFYVDDGVFAPGFPAATLGFILDEVRTAAIAAGSPLAWLTPTWSTTLDSAGNAWDRDLKWNVNHDQTFLQLQEYARRWNYEFRIRWDNSDLRFEQDIFNPTEGGQTRPIAITGKSGVTGSAPIVRRPPDFTYMRVEGEIGRWGEHASTTLDDVWGRLEKTHNDRQGVFSEELDELAERMVTTGQNRTASRAVELEDPSLLPWTSFEPGDIVTLNLAPKDTKQQLRVAAIVASRASQQAAPKYSVHFGSPVLSNEAAMAQGLRTLLREFRRPIAHPPAAKLENPPIRFGWASFIAIAALDSSTQAKQAAHFVCDGTDDDVEWNLALNAVSKHGGTIIAAPGNYTLTKSLTCLQMGGDVSVYGPGAILHCTSSIPTVSTSGKPIFHQAIVTATPDHIPTLSFEGIIFDGDDVTLSSAIVMRGSNLFPHMSVRYCTFQGFDGLFIHGEHGGNKRFDIFSSSFINSNMVGVGLTSPNAAAIRFNNASSSWQVRILNDVFTDIVIPANYDFMVDIQLSSGLPSIAADNIVEDCSRTGGGFVAFNGSASTLDGIHSNWINGTWTP